MKDIVLFYLVVNKMPAYDELVFDLCRYQRNIMQDFISTDTYLYIKVLSREQCKTDYFKSAIICKKVLKNR